MAYLETVFASMACINGSFLLPNNEHYGCNTKIPGTDLKKAEEAFAVISRIENTSIKELVSIFFVKNGPALLTTYRSNLPLGFYFNIRLYSSRLVGIIRLDLYMVVRNTSGLLYTN